MMGEEWVERSWPGRECPECGAEFGMDGESALRVLEKYAQHLEGHLSYQRDEIKRLRYANYRLREKLETGKIELSGSTTGI
jgi:hypothetical protein